MAPQAACDGLSGQSANPYYLWVDQHDILGLGANPPIATGNQSDSLHALVDGRIIELRVPYPKGSSPSGSMRGSTIPARAGKAAGSGSPPATEPRFISRASTRPIRARPVRQTPQNRAR
jgi:hypothetical protein